MQKPKKRGLYESGKIVFLPVGKLSPGVGGSPMNHESLRELTASISRYGVLQPLSVCRNGDGYRIISGERRWLAAKRAGLEEIPCVVMDVNEPETEVLGLIENLQRRGFDFIEEAESLRRLIYLHGYSRQDVARRLGISQSAIANKLRILRLPKDLLYALREAGLTERHARALLRLEDSGEIKKALEHIINEGLNVSQTDEFIDSLTGAKKRLYLIHDLHMFVNTVSRGVELLRSSGVRADMEQRDTETGIVLTVRIDCEREDER